MPQEDTGFFQLNDIILDIPPEYISIKRRSVHNSYQTIRTSSSTKDKSGLSRIDIDIKVIFTDTPSSVDSSFINGFEKLQALVAQFRVTPFCYVENKFIRSKVFGNADAESINNRRNMALVLKQFEVTKNSDTTNALIVIMRFCWFNYLPYMRNFTFKKQIFSSEEVANPIESEAWRLLYRAELQRRNYAENYQLDGDATFSFREFNTTQVRNISTVLNRREAFKDARNYLADTRLIANDSLEQLSSNIYNRLRQKLAEDEAKTTTEQLIGHTTSMTNTSFKKDSAGFTKQLAQLLDQNIDISSSSKYNIQLGEYSWTPVVMSNGSILRSPGDLSSEKRNDKTTFSPNDSIVIERERSINAKQSGLIITDISISFENILSMMPIIGHAYPTFQHVGSTDAVITMNVITTSQQGIRDLSDFYTAVENQTHKFRHVPQGQRNVRVVNDLVNLCGLQEFIIDSMIVENVPGQPETYRGSITLIDNPISSSTRENIAPGQQLTSRRDLRIAVARILEENIKLRSNVFTEEENIILSDSVGLRTYEETDEQYKKRRLDAFRSGLRGAEIPDRREIANYFPYVPKPPNTLQEKDAAFRELCEQYGQHMSRVFANLVDVLQDVSLLDIIDRGDELPLTGPVAELYSLTDYKLPGVEFLQNALLPVIRNNQRLAGEFGTSLDEIRNTSQDIIQNTEQRTETRLRQLRNARAGNSFVDDLAYDEEERKLINERSRLGDFINDHLLDWHTKTRQLLDNILITSKRELPQFTLVREALNAQFQSNTGNCYPDFPLENVVEVLEQDAQQSGEGQRILKEAISQLEELAAGSNLALKNLGLSALIQPDFYLFSQQKDTIDEIVPRRLLTSASQAIVKIHSDHRVVAEENWIETTYKKRILGEERYIKARRDATAEQEKDSVFWRDSDNKREIQRIIRSRRESDPVFAPDFLDLGVQDTEGLGCSSAEFLIANDKPIELVPINLSKDEQNITTARRFASDSQIRPPDHWHKAKHRLGVSAIKQLPHVAYLPPQEKDPTKTPRISWPVGPEAQIITSPFVPNPPGRKHPNLKNNGTAVVRAHKGIDLAARGPTRGLPVYAAEDGTLVGIKFSPTESKPGGKPPGGEGNSIVIKHNGGWVTRYFHLQWDDTYQALSDLFWGRSGPGVPNQRNPFEVIKGSQIGTIGNSGTGTGPHLHFETHKDGEPIDPQEVIDGTFTKHQGPPVGINPENESLMTKSVEQLEKDLNNGQGYSMMRAYPTFRLYFIESDATERKRFGFDDFFSYSAVNEIQVIRNKKLAADLAIIQLTNISGVLTNRKYKNSDDPSKGRDKNGKIVKEDLLAANLADENPLASIMLQPGIQMQLRLGYNSNPEELDVVMNGVVAEVNSLENDNIIEIVCQSFGIELVQNIYGDVKTFGGFLSDNGRTAEILQELLALPQIVHFGRWEGGEALQSFRGLLTTRWNASTKPQDDNIFAPTGRGIRGIFDSTTKYVMYHTTAWDVFQEMTLRHPGMIAYPVPYAGRFGPRMTMFFGLPDQLYFARDPSVGENRDLQDLKRFTKEANRKLINNRSTLNKALDSNQEVDIEEIDTDLQPVEDPNKFAARKFWLSRVIKNLALDKGIIRPFRSYHVLTSTWNIIDNNISNVLYNTFNTVTLQYGDDDPEVDEQSSRLTVEDLETLTLKCDAALPEEESREMFAQYPNCVGFEMAKQYCVGLLFGSLKQGYRGNIKIMGNGRIKPYDVCYIFDEYTDMFGPIEVEQVVHTFNKQQGFVSDITPAMMVHVNQLSTVSTSDVMGLAVEGAIRSTGMDSMASVHGETSNIPGGSASALANAAVSAVGTVGSFALGSVGRFVGFSAISNAFFNQSELSLGQNASTNPVEMLFVFSFQRLLTRTQLEHPFRYSPLVKSGKPMVGGLPNRYTDGTFVAGINRFFKKGTEGFKLLIDDFYDKAHPNNWLGRGQGSFVDAILGTEEQ